MMTLFMLLLFPVMLLFLLLMTRVVDRCYSVFDVCCYSLMMMFVDGDSLLLL